MKGTEHSELEARAEHEPSASDCVPPHDHESRGSTTGNPTNQDIQTLQVPMWIVMTVGFLVPLVLFGLSRIDIHNNATVSRSERLQRQGTPAASSKNAAVPVPGNMSDMATVTSVKPATAVSSAVQDAMDKGDRNTIDESSVAPPRTASKAVNSNPEPVVAPRTNLPPSRLRSPPPLEPANAGVPQIDNGVAHRAVTVATKPGQVVRVKDAGPTGVPKQRAVTRSTVLASAPAGNKTAARRQHPRSQTRDRAPEDAKITTAPAKTQRLKSSEAVEVAALKANVVKSETAQAISGDARDPVTRYIEDTVYPANALLESIGSIPELNTALGTGYWCARRETATRIVDLYVRLTNGENVFRHLYTTCPDGSAGAVAAAPADAEHFATDAIITLLTGQGDERWMPATINAAVYDTGRKTSGVIRSRLNALVEESRLHDKAMMAFQNDIPVNVACEIFVPDIPRRIADCMAAAGRIQIHDREKLFALFLAIEKMSENQKLDLVQLVKKQTRDNDSGGVNLAETIGAYVGRQESILKDVWQVLADIDKIEKHQCARRHADCRVKAWQRCLTSLETRFKNLDSMYEAHR